MGLVVVGSVAFDSIETPSDRAEMVLGGSAVYSSMIASYFSPVELVGVVGEDFTESHRSILESKGVGIEGLETVAGGKTFFWEGRYGEDPNDRETLALEMNVFEDFRPKLPEGARSPEWVFLGNIDPEIQIDLLDQIDGKAHVGCDTMDFWIQNRPEKLRELLGRVDTLFINDSEARLLSSELNLVNAGRKILTMGPSSVVIKKGEHGALLISGGTMFLTPAFPLEKVVDPTGAGDSFAGGFMGYLASAGKSDQDDLKKGRAYEQASYDAQDRLFSKVINTWNVQSNIYPGVDFVYLERKDNFIYDGDATGKRTAEKYHYDEAQQLGNLTSVEQLGEVDITTGNDVGNDKRTVFTVYHNNTSNGNWLVGIPRYTYVQDQFGVQTRRTWFA